MEKLQEGENYACDWSPQVLALSSWELERRLNWSLFAPADEYHASMKIMGFAFPWSTTVWRKVQVTMQGSSEHGNLQHPWLGVMLTFSEHK